MAYALQMLLLSVPLHAITDITMKNYVFIHRIHLVTRVMDASRGQSLEPDTVCVASLMQGDIVRMCKFDPAHFADARCG